MHEVCFDGVVEVLDAERGFEAGAVYAYRYDEAAERWEQEAKFWPEAVGERSFVGRAVALSGGVIRPADLSPRVLAV